VAGVRAPRFIGCEASSVDRHRVILDGEPMLRTLVTASSTLSTHVVPVLVMLALVVPGCSSRPTPRQAASEAEAESARQEPSTADSHRHDAQEDTVTERPATNDPTIDPVVAGTNAAGAAPSTQVDPLSEPTGVVDEAQFVGRWVISGSIPSASPPGSPPGSGGGAIGWMREYELRADHSSR